MQKEFFSTLTDRMDAVAFQAVAYLRRNAKLIAWLAGIALVCYGFELFNFNLTIDEEVHAASYGADPAWLAQGRWGMWSLTKSLFPYTEIPVVPLFVALAFHIGAILLSLSSWRVESRLEQALVGAVNLALPVMAYLYTFSTFNFGIGIGLFCAAASVFVWSRKSARFRWLAFVPAAFSISIYQGFIPVLLAAFLLYILAESVRTGQVKIGEAVAIAGTLLLAALTWYAVQKLLMSATGIRGDSYVSQFFDVAALGTNFGWILQRVAATMLRVYLGDASVYGIPVSALGPLLLLSLCGWVVTLRSSNLSMTNKVIVLPLPLALLALPFAIGLFTRGYIALRFLVSLPIVVSGVVMLGLRSNPRIFKTLLAFLAGVAVFQFAISTNHLFAASHLALEEDRLLAAQLMTRIQDAKAAAGQGSPKYLEVVGFLKRPATQLIPQIETFGASFFEWDEGNVGRVLLFMQTVGYQGLQPLPLARRAQMIEIADSMPAWPENGSVKVSADTVLIKFGDYSHSERLQICGQFRSEIPIHYKEFCGQ